MRQSNIELLRVVSMLMVLAVHIDGASLGLPHICGSLGGLTYRDIWQLAVESLAIVGVNCFTLISGYFGIRLRARTIGAYLFQCVFYAVGIYTLVWCVFPDRLDLTGWLESWLVLTHTDLWYVPAYFGLMLLAPMLNAGFDALTRRQSALVIGLFAIYNIWAGWWWGGAFNPTGYTLIQLILMYLIGRWLATHFHTARRSLFFTAIYLAASAATMLYACYRPDRAFAYNAPLVMLASGALLMAFARLRLTSPTINYVARSAFAVYLLHKAPLIWGNVMRPAVIWLWNNLSLTGFTFAAVALMAGIYAMAMCVDWVRRKLSQLIFRT